MGTHSRATPYADAVARRAGDAAGAWWQGAWSALDAALSRSGLCASYAGAGRRLGQAIVALDDAERAAIQRAELRVVDHWALDDFARAALIVRAVELLDAAEHVSLIDDLFLRGDNRERHAVLQTLCTLPRPERFLVTAVEACRSNVLTVFQAIACENPYPATHFPDANFNQMVLKALFNQVSVARIERLAERVTPELLRMCDGYASERSAAGRSVPQDIAFIHRLAR